MSKLIKICKVNTAILAVVIAFAGILHSSLIRAQFYNGSQMEFGKNRVQYDEFLWSYYRFEKIETYFYPGGKELAIYTAKTATDHISDLEAIFDYEIENNIQFIIYNKQSHFRQSNLGASTDNTYNIGGVTNIVGSKVFIYFEGDHAKLDAQIRAGVAEVLVNEMLYGGDWREIMKNSALLVLPDWYLQGLISYAADPWNVYVENKVKDGVLSGKYDKFNRLAGDNAVNAGHSMWHFIAETYGPNTVSNILYMTHVSRNIESGFLFVLGASLKTLTMEWMNYYKTKYETLDDTRILAETNLIPVKNRKNRVYSQLKSSPDGRYVAFVSNELGQYKVFIYDKEKKRMKRILKEGHRLLRINDFSYPILSWHPAGQMLAIMVEDQAKPHLLLYSLEDKKTESRPIFILDKILDFSYSPDGREMVFSAVLNGQSDIYIYNIGANTQNQITKDIFDDLNPRFINKGKQVIFSSNRTDDTIRTKGVDIKSYNSNRDVFIYDLASKSNVLKRVTNTHHVDELQPQQWNDNDVTYLSNQNRVYNRFVAEFDSVISHIDTAAHYRQTITAAPITNYPRHILEHETETKAGKLSEIVFHNGKYKLFLQELGENPEQNFQNFEQTPFPLNKSKIPEKSKTSSATTKNKNNSASKQAEPQQQAKDTTVSKSRFQSVKVFDETSTDSTMVDINNYKFDKKAEAEKRQNPVSTQKDTAFQSIIKKEDNTDEPEEFILPNLRNYNITYYTNYVVSQIDNNLTNLSYQPFMGGGGFFNPGMNGLFKIGISDLFDNRRIMGGVRLSPNLQTNEYLLSYEDYTRRLNRQYIFNRRGMMLSDGITLKKIHTHEIRHVLSWPFSEVASVRGTASLRQDRKVTLATDYDRLRNYPTLFDYWAGAKLEYVFDNVLPLGVNLNRGTRSKIFAEYYRHLQIEGVNIYVLGLDFRHYIKIHRDFIWANRFAASTSLGSHKLIYFMGGVDNWLLPRFDQETRIDYSQNYVFQTLATNMRGFHQNARNGNSFAVINSELRMPIFRYLVNQPIKSDFINNFQIIGFTDIGTAWNGLSPYSEDNTLNTEIIYANPFVITLKNQKEPIIAGYGFGLRSRLWGYFIRADWAWGVEDGVVKPRIFYLSLSLDF
ncbi:MAG: PD40 domain-containing protein [Bacteroidetes bacterium]|nr:PD40 domain-containing protein [Bacteroidota bacterium]HET6243300.1 hypothetical protein [Bacteroidia bacterium]